MSFDDRALISADAWALLRAGRGEATDSGIPTIRGEASTPAGPLRYSLGQQGEARMLIPVVGGAKASGLAGTRFLRVGFGNYILAGRSSRYLDLTCLSRDLELVFGEVVDEISKRIQAGSEGIDAAATTIADFRELLERGRDSSVPTSSITGLVGELLYLNRLLDLSPGAWRTWRGPAGDRHDFRSGNSSVEIKTTGRAGNRQILVHGTEQLEAPAGGTLHVLHLTLEAVAGGLLSVSSLGRGALNKADDPNALLRVLAAIGCDDVEGHEWNIVSYRLESECLYEVCEGFPRISRESLTGGALHPGVTDLTYVADLAFAEHCRRDGARAAALDQEIASCRNH